MLCQMLIHASTDGSLYVQAYVEPEAEEDTGVMPIQRQRVNVFPDSEPQLIIASAAIKPMNLHIA